jgi:hypothetical protein
VSTPAIFRTKTKLDPSRLPALKTSGTVHKANGHGCPSAEAERKYGTAADLVPGAVTHVHPLVESVFAKSKIAK